MKYPIAKIQVEERFREADPEALAALVESFKKFGQLQPIVIAQTGNSSWEEATGAYELVAGLHRLSAAKLLGWTEIEAVDQGAITEVMAREIELEENVRRKDMSWKERAIALSELNRLKSAADPTWTLDKTAAVAGVSKSRISESDKILVMMKLFPEIGEAKDMAQATKLAYRKAKLINRVQAVADGPVDYSTIEDRLVLGDSVDVIKTVPSESFHAVITDPPFGINYEDRAFGSAGLSLSAYKDDEDSYRRLLSMAPDLYRVIRPDGWLIWFCGNSWYEEAKTVFRAAGFTVDEIPIIWDRSGGGTHVTRNPDRWFTRAYDIALHCVKGHPRLVRTGTNILHINPVEGRDKELLVERPIELYAELISRLTIRGETVADFFTGSGSCLAAAASLGRSYFGVEMSPERRAYAIQKIQAHTLNAD